MQCKYVLHVRHVVCGEKASGMFHVAPLSGKVEKEVSGRLNFCLCDLAGKGGCLRIYAMQRCSFGEAENLQCIALLCCALRNMLGLFSPLLFQN